MISVTCSRCRHWDSTHDDGYGYCKYGDESGRCFDGRLIRGLYPVTGALDGCVYAQERPAGAPGSPRMDDH